MSYEKLRLRASSSVHSSHCWQALENFEAVDADLPDGSSVGVYDSTGEFRGTGIWDRTDSVAVWRRFSLAEDLEFDEAYIAAALQESIQRRGDESSQRLVSSDADFIPGLVVELFNDVAVVSVETLSIRAHLDFILSALRDALDLVEVVVDDQGERRTMSGNNLKARWIEVDELLYRIDFLNPTKPGFPLGLREQHVLFGSLCEGRRVLDLSGVSGGFALQAMAHDAISSLAVDSRDSFAKAIGANAQRNGLQVEVLASDPLSFLKSQSAHAFDAIAVSLSAANAGTLNEICESAFRILPDSGLLAVYLVEGSDATSSVEDAISEAAGTVGREARVFARTAQPFDYPMLLRFPESLVIEGILLEVL